jgi:3-methyl-2-oxobutanoate hydroxymethyltransferase
MNIHELASRKKDGKKISMITCYDYSFARLISETSIDMILVGDSAAMTMHGHSSTLPINTAVMALHVAAVARGAGNKHIVGDMPFLSYRKSLTANMNAVEKLMKAGAHSIKLEGAHGNLTLVQHLVQSGVPVMGHLGLTPQSVHQLGGYKVQGRDAKAQELIRAQALQLQEAGCYAVVLECVPSHLAEKITKELAIPTIGIGAGVDCDGQVLVLQDLLGMNLDLRPKFVRKYVDGADLIKTAINHFHEDVQSKEFPSEKEAYK